jgi:hypothetical protein
MRNILLICAFTIAISGCVSTVGAKISPDQLAGFEKGITTESDIVNRLGRPAVSTASSDGTKILTYSFSNYKMSSPFSSGDMQISTTTFIMAADGTMASFQSSDTNINGQK